jgi:hypothetical protein
MLSQIAAAQFAVDRQIKQRQVAGLSRDLQVRAHRPDLGELQWWLLADQLALIPRSRARGLCGDGVAHRLFTHNQLTETEACRTSPSRGARQVPKQYQSWLRLATS